MKTTPPHPVTPTQWVVMGVSGCGKSTVGRALAAQCEAVFFDADDFHPEANVRKMSAGQALDDDDRAPWLERLNRLLCDTPRVVLACSALKRTYRQKLSEGTATPRFVYLHADFETLTKRMAERDHFMPPALLRSQLDTLEPPSTDEAVVLDATLGVDQLVAAIAEAR